MSTVGNGVMKTPERNHPHLAKMITKYSNDPYMFPLIDKLPEVETLEDFKTQVKVLSDKYDLFAEHLKSKDFTIEETWDRFLNHRDIAIPLFDIIKVDLRPKARAVSSSYSAFIFLLSE